MINFKVGIMGAGKISDTIADTLNKLDAFEPYAIASRDIDKANSFGDKHNIQKRYGSYEELVNDPDVELIYIATPHSHHAQQAKMCINAGKPVLVEKAFSYNYETAKEVLDLSKEKNVFCGEAMWIRYLPMYLAIFDYIRKGAIGKIFNVTCSLGYDLRKKERVIRPELAGGVLLDLGVYPLNLLAMLFGNDEAAIASSSARLETGVDARDVIQFNFKGGRSATITLTLMYKADNRAMIYGDLGYIEIENMNCPEVFRIYHGDGTLAAEVKKPDKQISGYEFEFMSARNAIILGKIETPNMPHSETLRILSITDLLRKQWNFKFPMEEN